MPLLLLGYMPIVIKILRKVFMNGRILWFHVVSLAAYLENIRGEVAFTTCFARIYQFIRNNKKTPMVQNKLCSPQTGKKWIDWPGVYILQVRGILFPKIILEGVLVTPTYRYFLRVNG